MGGKQQLLDSLTAHISLYHSRVAAGNPTPPTNPSYRAAVLRWFSSLSVHQRRAHLTVFDRDFVAILLQMNEKLRSRGHGRFIILPDLPQSDSTLPTLCFRKSDGLLERFSEIDNPGLIIRQSIGLFSSKEDECKGAGNGPPCLDAILLTESLLKDAYEFVGIMDRITNGEFLGSGEEAEMAGEWVELRWLKAKGYYSLEEFVVNRLEIALRLAWMNSNAGKKRGVKLKEKLGAAGVAANLFWRKKGCVEWWEKLDDAVKRKVYNAYVGKASRSLTLYIVKHNTVHLDDNIWCCDTINPLGLRCNPASLGEKFLDASYISSSRTKFDAIPKEVSKDLSPLPCIVNSLYILQVLSLLSTALASVCDPEKIFFSSLDSVNSIPDVILRKLREVLLVVSLDCTKFELLDEVNLKPPLKKSNEKSVPPNRKKKLKNSNKKSNPLSRSAPDDSKYEESKDDVNRASDGFSDKAPENDLQRNYIPAKAMETFKGADDGKFLGVTRKSRKEKKKSKSSKYTTLELPTTGVSGYQDGSMLSNSTSQKLSVQLSSKSVVANGKGDASISHSSRDDGIPSLSCDQECSIAISSHTIAGTDDSLISDHDSSSRNVEPLEKCSDTCAEPLDSRRNAIDSLRRPVKDGELQTSFIQDHPIHIVARVGAAVNSPAYVSYEWPNVAPIHQLTNPHLPAATDRLHLDVGHNLQNHFYHSFLQNLQPRKSSGQKAYSGIIRSMPISLDCPPSLPSFDRCIPSFTCSYDAELITRRQSSFQSVSCGTNTSEDERTVCGEIVDCADITSSQELVDEHDKNWMSEEESETQALGMIDYNQYFGGGVMYWNPSDCLVNNFSRPPSLCSDDSSWAWREADLNRSVDDMVTFSSSYSGLTSPSAASFCSPFDPLAVGNIGYVVSGSEISGKILHSSKMAEAGAEESIVGSVSSMGDAEGKTLDTLPYPILRPIIIPNMSREKPRSEFRRSYDHKSPRVPPNRREQPRIKRPPSPVVLCVPSAPRPPPPSPVGDSRKHRGFPTVRSGSSSPRHWGVKSWFHDGANSEDANVPVEGNGVIWPCWRNKGIAARQLTQPLAGKLLQDRLVAICQLARDREHPDVKFPLQPPETQNSSINKVSQSMIHDTLHEEINSFCKKVAAENLMKKPYINWAVKRVTRSLQVLWPRSRTNIFGSNATGLALPSSDVDLVICLPPVRNLEPIKEAGILEGRNGIKETCLQHAARYLANQEWVKSDSLKIVENTAIPIIMVVVEVPHDVTSTWTSIDKPLDQADEESFATGNPSQSDPASAATSSQNLNARSVNENDGLKSVRLDISFKSPTHSGIQTTGLVKDLTEQFPALTPLALVLKQFLADRGLDQSYSGGLNSYCLILLITRFLQHEHHHGRPTNQNYGSLLMDFLYFFGNVFDPKRMRICVQGSGVYLNRERGCSIDPLHIDDPLLLTNNVGRNCFRIHQCIKAFADAYAMLEHKLTFDHKDGNTENKPTQKVLPKLIPSMAQHLNDFPWKEEDQTPLN